MKKNFLKHIGLGLAGLLLALSISAFVPGKNTNSAALANVTTVQPLVFTEDPPSH